MEEIDTLLSLKQGYRMKQGDKITLEASRRSNLIRIWRQDGSLPSEKEGLDMTGKQE